MSLFSTLRPYLPFPTLMGALVGLVIGLGYGATFLSEGKKPTREELASLHHQEKADAREPVGHHAVTEWPTDDGRVFGEAPSLRERVQSSEIPPVRERLPREPLVIVPPEQRGPYGGTWRSFGTGVGDIGVMSGASGVCYEPLIRWDPLLQSFHPNLAKEWSIEDDAKIFTFRLRKGLRWSDGHPFTADDVLFWYRHILLNSSLTPAVPQVYLRNGEVMKFEKLDDYTIRFTFAEPHGLFLQWVANPLMTELVRYPAHYFQNFHPDFVDSGELEREARRDGFSFWHQAFLYKAEWHNLEKPTLAAWTLTRPPPARQITFDRNPYYWKVDPEGNQLPYIDRLTYEISALETMTLRFLRGDMGVQYRHISLQDYPLLVEHQETGNYRINEWISSFGSGVLMPNLNHRDPGLRELFNDRRFRLALSYAIDRREISEARYLGLGRPMQLSPTFTSPLYRPEYASTHTGFDREKANRLLNEIGLTQRDPRGMRLRPDGSPLKLTIEMFDLIVDVQVMHLVADFWRAVGIDAEVKQLARSLYYARMPARLHDVAVGGNSSMNTPLLDHMFFVPFGLGARHALAYAAWFMSGGERGEEPPPEMKRAMELYTRIERTAHTGTQHVLAHEILKINAENLWLIGLVGDLPGITLVHDSFRNVPDHAVIFGNAGVTAPECYAIEDPSSALQQEQTQVTDNRRP